MSFIYKQFIEPNEGESQLSILLYLYRDISFLFPDFFRKGKYQQIFLIVFLQFFFFSSYIYIYIYID